MQAGYAKIADSPSISVFIACCQRFDRQVLYKQLRQTVTLNADKRRRLLFAETVDKVFMTRGLK